MTRPIHPGACMQHRGTPQQSKTIKSSSKPSRKVPTATRALHDGGLSLTGPSCYLVTSGNKHLCSGLILRLMFMWRSPQATASRLPAGLATTALLRHLEPDLPRRRLQVLRPLLLLPPPPPPPPHDPAAAGDAVPPCLSRCCCATSRCRRHRKHRRGMTTAAWRPAA